jgi:hypothetical protein
MRINMCPLPRCGWTHETLLRPAVLLAYHMAITYLNSSGLAERVDLMKVAPGLEQLRAFAVDMSLSFSRGPIVPHCVQLLPLRLRMGRPAHM